MSNIDMKAAVAFANAVAEAMNKAGVKAVGEYCAVLTVLGDPDTREPPIGCSINFDDKAQAWAVDVDMLHAVPANEDSEPS